MDNPTRRSDPVYDIKLCKNPLSPAPSSPAPAPVEMAQGLAEPGSVRAIFASRRNGATQPASTLYGADISGTLDGDETEFVLAVMRLATGAHPFAAIRMLTLAIIELRRGPTEPLGHAPEAKPEPDVVPAWVKTPADRAWHFCERAARGDHLTYVEVEQAFLPFVGLDRVTLDDRKPWVEPTVTECATTNRRQATLTIAGIDLPNPAPPAPTIAPTAAEILNAVGWLRNRAGLQPVRTAEFESIARIMEGLGAEIVRQAAEISELQGMLEDAIGPVRLVRDLACMNDFECAHVIASDIRSWARGQHDGDFTLPRLYGEEDRRRAVAAMLGRDTTCQGTVEYHAGAIVDIVAEALGLQRAS